ncbi:flagellar brake protein [Klebsiella variicola]|uniref:flagellar brake protein n=1 Tax=Klebsiella variicola TaxID=244366 RepID=UPI00292B3BE8|nr:PilZ domain-containing protein [Klebsiella variicola]MDV0910901.1 PilZ domain-containing protein [Klebsiella variicola subsp. variicola]HBR0931144.1 PilZ domain-containing protein [Klebsiella variicola]HBR1095559.1 PilZ domain-containing protein [Klebsiella variicola]HBU5898179.1 PilZ domain-containing protein [Klebsiella variicola]
MEVKVNNPYEIIAIIRGELRKHGLLRMSINEDKFFIKIESIDATGFLIVTDFLLTSRDKYNLKIFSENGIFIFCTKIKVLGVRGGMYEHFIEIPNTMFFSQRRNHKRVDLSEMNYKCIGIFKDGTQFNLRIKNISEGGCALISETTFPSFNKILKHVFLMKNDIIKIVMLDMEVKDTIQMSDARGYIHSCQFLFKKKEDKDRVEKEILFIEACKRKRKK